MSEVEATTFCGACGTHGSVRHRCPARTLPDRPPEDTEALVPMGFPRAPRDLGDAPGDLALLATWLPVIEGRAAGVEPTIASGARNGRLDGIDARHHDLADALRALARLSALPWRHRVVLAYAYVRLDDEARTRFGQGFDTHLGLVFVAHKRRLAWCANVSVSQAQRAAAAHGAALRTAAIEAYGAAPDDVPPSDGRWLTGAMDLASRLVALAEATQRTGKGRGHRRVVAR